MSPHIRIGVTRVVYVMEDGSWVSHMVGTVMLLKFVILHSVMVNFIGFPSWHL